MRNVARFMFVLLAVLTTLAAIHGQQGFFRSPDMQGLWAPVVGAGGSYEILSSSGEKSLIDAFIVGKESAGGKDGYWVEIVKHDAANSAKPFIIKSLATFNDGSLQISRAIIQIGEKSPLELPMQDSGQSAISIDIRAKGSRLGNEAMVTPAGKFLCEHWRSEDGGEFWLSDRVSPYGLVKSKDKDGGGMTLVHLITNAKDKMMRAEK